MHPCSTNAESVGAQNAPRECTRNAHTTPNEHGELQKQPIGACETHAAHTNDDAAQPAITA